MTAPTITRRPTATRPRPLTDEATTAFRAIVSDYLARRAARLSR
ncbi:hypothetical protein [Micromonospora sp. KLBMP9576]